MKGFVVDHFSEDFCHVLLFKPDLHYMIKSMLALGDYTHMLCGLSSIWCNKVGKTQLFRISLFAVALRFLFAGTRVQTCQKCLQIKEKNVPH